VFKGAPTIYQTVSGIGVLGSCASPWGLAYLASLRNMAGLITLPLTGRG
jgi:hypothetical protein